MNIEQLIYISPLILGLIIIFFLLIFFFFKKKNLLSISFMLILINLLFWLLMSIMELVSAGNDATIFWARLRYFSICSMPTLLFVFVFGYFEKKEFISIKNIMLISLVPFLGLFSALTNKSHYLFFTQELVKILKYGLSSVIFEKGIFFWVFIAYSYLLIFFICIFLAKKISDNDFNYKSQAILFLIATAMPFLGSIIFNVKPFGWNFDYDLTPFLFMISAIILVISIFKYKFLNISSIARNEIFDELDDALIILNENNEIVDFNKKAAELSKKLDIRNMKAGMNAKELLKNTKLNIETDSEFSLSNGSIFYYNSSIKKMLVNNEQVGIILSVKDITKIKEFEKVKAENAKDKEIIDLRDEFITRVSHELRQPLMSIMGYTKELKSIVKEKQANKYLEKIINNSQNLNELVEKTIKLSQIKSKSNENISRFKISALLQNSIANPRIKLSIKDDFEAKADKSQLLEAINNLIENALKYSKKEVMINAYSSKKESIIEIIDKGKGIAQKIENEIEKGAYLAKVDAEELKKGFGIGFMISRAIINSYGGKIGLISKKGKGTTARIIFPKIKYS